MSIGLLPAFPTYSLGRPLGSLGESGRPRYPVTVDIMGSNPIWLAKFIGARMLSYPRLA